MADVHVFGIRHHGPGSARSLLNALERLEPDAILIEGPPDADDILPLAAYAGMRPPVALLVYAVDDPKQAAFFPFAVFSPEWQALRYGLARGVPVRFMDLPQAYQIMLRWAEDGPGEPADAPPLRDDPLGALAEAAGFQDGERWWEQMVEQRHDSRDVFDAVLEIMTTLRESPQQPETPLTLLREAHMRESIRAASRSGAERIAVVCGAWHAPALATLPPAKEDKALLTKLKKTKVAATWVPWTHGRLLLASGYGAGVWSPGWYQHLWETQDDVVTGWLVEVAHLLRSEQLDASPAQVIDAVRLTETLAALRGRPAAGLDELNEAALAVFCFGSDLPMRLIHDRLIVGEAMGDVPDENPMVPLQRDLQQEQKRLRMAVESGASLLDLDLRKPLHMDRSHLLNRLRLLGVPWGVKQDVTGKGGTFHEVWQVQWQPELTIALVEQSGWGNTVVDAAAAYTRHEADHAHDLPALTRLVHDVLLADLPDAVAHVVRRLQEKAALTSEVNLLMASLPALADVLMYGSVRKTDAGMVGAVVDGIVTRTCINLPGASSALDDDAADELFGLTIRFNSAIRLLDNPAHWQTWIGVLNKLVDQRGAHGLMRGRSCRILLDADELTMAEAMRQMRLAVSTVEDPAQAAAWITGFLYGSGVILLHDATLLGVLDDWIASLADEDFVALLPLLRRTFSTFSEPERKQIGRLVKRGPSATPAEADAVTIDQERADAILPILAELLGLEYP
ncbi:MAG TPA: DUF5682 family protein [Aggregatilinea sp.]|jgi:hypothetical protein|uniref:DUF5682 family protein n=1 Tax=Aggregatilinea sp. TaxID=2806333 RepID=UPI002C271EE9|nr:DUF5682 family protein [Aggregatilinea sp.]HML20882.1 DUF5682 family protein [Aggregatilinea sp.]